MVRVNEVCPFVTHLSWVEEALNSEHSELARVDGLDEGMACDVALSQFGGW